MSAQVKPFTYEMDPNYDYILDEKGNTYTALRKIRWGNREDYKLDLRKYYATEDGEKMSKGCSFSDEAADELVKTLISTGYGNADAVAESICTDRIDIAARIVKSIEENDILARKVEKEKANIPESEEFYDLEDVI